MERTVLKRRPLPPPERLTLHDGLQILFGIIMIPLGSVILVNTLARGAVLPALLIGGAFVGFGIYRTVFAAGRIRWYLASRRIEDD